MIPRIKLFRKISEGYNFWICNVLQFTDLIHLSVMLVFVYYVNAYFILQYAARSWNGKKLIGKEIDFFLPISTRTIIPFRLCKLNYSTNFNFSSLIMIIL